MSKAVIHYFTGTGNSARVSKLTSKQLERFRYEVTTIDIENPKPEAAADLTLFIFPVYAGGMPHIVYNYIKKLPKEKNAQTAVIACYGYSGDTPFGRGNPGATLLQTRKCLRKKGYIVFYEQGVPYPANMTEVSPPPPKEARNNIIETGDKKVERFIKEIIDKTETLQPINIANRVVAYISNLVYRWIGRRGLGKIFVANKNCNGCKKCERACPVKAVKISKKGRPHWNYSCEGCQRCINLCPQEAIQGSLLRLIHVGFVAILQMISPLLLLIPGFITLLHLYLLPTQPTWLFVASYLLVCMIVAPVLLFVVGDLFFLLLEKIPFIGRVVHISFSKRFVRYLAPGFLKG